MGNVRAQFTPSVVFLPCIDMALLFYPSYQKKQKTHSPENQTPLL